MPRPTIAFLSDFGTRDHYVGAMKGAALTICPDAALVDITHEIEPQDVLQGALELDAAFRFFPPGTIFVAVVDPGVGSTRRGIAAAAHGYRFVAPDNGLLTPVLGDFAAVEAVELTERRYARAAISRTFEGRDRFAPAAAWMAVGTPLAALGPRISDPVRLRIPTPVGDADGLRGEVVRVDRFGNLVTNIDRAAVTALGADRVRVRAGTHDVGGLVGTYADVPPGAPCALFGSSDRLEVAVSGGSAAARLGLARGAPVVVTRT